MTHWPLRDLVLRTPRLELRPDDGLDELIEAAYAGVHPHDEMLFLVRWTDADPRYLGRELLRYFWSQRAALAPERWTINFLIRHDDRVIGTQGMSGADFDHLGALRARSDAFPDNHASHRVSA